MPRFTCVVRAGVGHEEGPSSLPRRQSGAQPPAGRRPRWPSDLRLNQPPWLGAHGHLVTAPGINVPAHWADWTPRVKRGRAQRSVRSAWPPWAACKVSVGGAEVPWEVGRRCCPRSHSPRDVCSASPAAHRTLLGRDRAGGAPVHGSPGGHSAWGPPAPRCPRDPSSRHQSSSRRQQPRSPFLVGPGARQRVSPGRRGQHLGPHAAALTAFRGSAGAGPGAGPGHAPIFHLEDDLIPGPGS